MTPDRRQFLAAGVKLTAGSIIGATALGSRDEAGRSATAVTAAVDLLAVTTTTSDDRTDPSPTAAPHSLSVNGRAQPVGIDPDDVNFAWRLAPGPRGIRQVAYRITLESVATQATTTEKGAPWQSGEVQSGRQAFVTYDGPALQADNEFRWHLQSLDQAGVWSQPASATFVTGLRTGDWRGQWLQPGAPLAGPEEYTYLRTAQTIPNGQLTRAVAYVAAAHRFELWVNGVVVGSGPSFCYPDEQYYQALDVTSWLQPGQLNAIGVLHHWYGPGQGRPASSPGLLANIALHYSNGTSTVIATDSQWRARKAAWLPAPLRNSDVGDFVEIIDGRLEPVGWTDASYHDDGWDVAPVLGPVGTEPFTGLVALRTGIEEEEIAPAAVRRLPDGAVVADFGKVYAARPKVVFADGQAGRPIAVQAGYLLDPGGHVSTVHGTQQTNMSFGYIQREGGQTFLPFTFLGFRYLEVSGFGIPGPEPELAMVARHASMPEATGATLSSSDPTVDAVWQLGTHSALYCTQEQFIDTPTREKGQFLWDAANESQVMMRAFGDQNMTWQALRDFANSQRRYWPDGRVNAVYPNGDGARDFPTFTALYPEWIWRYYLSTGDLTSIQTWYPAMEGVAGYLWSHVDPTSGLISGLVEEGNGDPDYGYDLNANVDTSVNALAVNALRRVAQVAQLVGDDSSASTQLARAAALTEAINQRLIRPDGVYADGIDPDGTLSSHASQQANVQALAYGVVPAARQAIVATYAAGLGMSVEPDHGMELLRGLAAGGRPDQTLRRVTDRTSQGWARVIAEGGTFTWEMWQPSDLIGDSMSHGWGSSVVVAMQEILLGVTPLPIAASEGGPRWSVSRPAPGLRHIESVMPSVAGPFGVRWQRGMRRWTLALDVPSNGTVVMSLGGIRSTQVTEGGTPLHRVAGVEVTTAGSQPPVITVSSGHYLFAVP